MLVNVTVLSESKGPSSSWHRQLTTIPPTNQKHSNLRHAFKPPSACSPQIFNHPTISSSADRVRPAPLLLAALRSQTTSPYCCSRREAPTTCQVSETQDNGSPMSERNWIGDFRPRPIGCSMGAASRSPPARYSAAVQACNVHGRKSGA